MLAGVSLLMTLLVSGCLPSPIGPSIGSILQGLTNSVDSIIANATTDAESDILTAAGSVESAISDAASAYAQDLNLTINQVSNTVSSSIAQLQNLVGSLQTTILQTLQAATNDAQQLVNEIPFTDKNPQVTSYSPHFIQQGNSATIQVTINGNFVYAAQAHLTPTLDVNGTTIHPVFHSTALDSFSLLITVLPAKPVTSLTLYTKQQGEITQNIVEPPGAPASGGWYLESYSTCQTQTFTDKFGADPGWTIIPSSVSAQIISERDPGNVQVTAIGDTASAQINAMTEPGGFCVPGIGSNGSGDVNFYLTYTEEQSTYSTVSTPVSIGWSSNPFLHVVNNGPNITISTQYTNLTY